MRRNKKKINRPVQRRAAHLQPLIDQRAGLAERFDAIVQAAAAEARALSGEETTETESLRAQIEGIDAQTRQIVDSANARERFDALVQGARQHRQEQEPDGFGSRVTAALRAADYRGIGRSPSIEVPGFAVRSPIMTDTFRPPIPQQVGAVEIEHSTPLLDLIRSIPVTSSVVEWLHKPGAAPLAAVAEEGALKSEATVAVELRTQKLDTVAHWVEFSRQFAEDEPALRAYVEGELRAGLLDKFEARAADAVVTAGGPSIDGAPSLQAGVRLAMARVRAAGLRPSAVILHPDDAAQLDLDLLNLAHQMVPGVSPWGLRSIEVGALPQGKAIVLDPRCMTRYVRSAATVHLTDSHMGNFTSNILTLLVEGRDLTVCQRPEGVVTATFGGAGKRKAS